MIRRRTRSTSRTGRRSRSNNDGRKRSTSKTTNKYEVEDKMNDLLTGYDSRLVSLTVFDGSDTDNEDDEEEDKKARPSKKISDIFPITRHRRTTKQSQPQQGEDESAPITHHITTNNKVPRFKIRNSTSQSPVLNRHHRRQFSNDHPHPSTDNNNNNNVSGRVKRREFVSQSPLTHRQRKQQPIETTTPQRRSNSTTRSVSSTSTYARYSNNVPPQPTKFVTSKFDATHCIFLGHPGQVKTSSSQHVQSGLKLKYTYLQQYTTHPSDTKGCLVLEGPPPLLHKFKSTNEPFLWTVPITLSSKQQQKMSKNNKPKRLSHYDDTHHDLEPTTMEALQHVNTYVHELIKHGLWDEAVKILLDSSKKSMQSCSSQTLYRKLQRMIFRNVGTIKLIKEKYDEAAYYFTMAVDSQQMEMKHAKKRKKKLSREDRIESTLDLSMSLSLHAMSLYALEYYDNASQTLMKALEVVRELYMESDHKYLLPQKDNVHHYYTSCKILNNIGCCVAGLGLLKNASRSFHRAILIYMNGFEDDGNNDNNSDQCDRLKHCHNLTATLAYLQTKCTLAKIVPPPFMLDASITLINLALILHEMERKQYAIICMKQAFLLQKKIFHGSHHLVLSTAESLAFLYVITGDLKKAIKIYESILRMDEDEFLSNGNHNYLAVMIKTLTDMYLVYKQLNKLESAIWCLRGILAHQQSEKKPNVEQIERTRKRLRADVQKLTENVEQESVTKKYSTHYRR